MKQSEKPLSNHVDPVILGAVNLLDPNCEPTDEQFQRLGEMILADVLDNIELMRENMRQQMERDLEFAREYVKRPTPNLFT